MGPRKPHNKTRSGCVQCKKRIVKCDESKPTCRNCIRVARSCSYLVVMPKDVASPCHGFYGSNERPLIDRSPSFSLLDFRLLHHFIMSTSRTLSPQRSIQRLWQTTVVQIAFTHDFLLREILALAALHLARSMPELDIDLSTISLEYQNVALREFRAEIVKISPTNCNALFAFTLLLFYHVHGEQSSPFYHSIQDQAADGLDSHWIRMARGVRAVFSSSSSWLEQGELAEVFAPMPSRECWPLGGQRAKEYDGRLACLESLWAGQPLGTSEPADVETYSEALFHLRLAYQRAFAFDHADRSKAESHSAAASASLTWLLSMPEVYLECLDRREPQALIILAHYAVLLGRIQDTWWSTPTAHSLVCRIQSLVGPKWKTWLLWPAEELGLYHDFAY